MRNRKNVNRPLTVRPFAVVPQLVEASQAWKDEFQAAQREKAENLRFDLEARTVTLSIGKIRKGKLFGLSGAMFPNVEVAKTAKGALEAKVIEMPVAVKKAA